MCNQSGITHISNYTEDQIDMTNQGQEILETISRTTLRTTQMWQIADNTCYELYWGLHWNEIWAWRWRGDNIWAWGQDGNDRNHLEMTWGQYQRLGDITWGLKMTWGWHRGFGDKEGLVKTWMTWWWQGWHLIPIIPHHSHFILKSCDLSFQPIGLLDTPKYHTSWDSTRNFFLFKEQSYLQQLC